VSRIIAGIAGGRRLVMPAGSGTRPTADRAREGLFSTLTSLHGSLSGASFLDLYAGSGAVGLEAASRGAGPVVLVERDPKALRAVRANVDTLGFVNAAGRAVVTVRAEPVERVLGVPPVTAYDVVFVDPPYATPVAPVLVRLVEAGWLADQGVVCVERTTRGPALTWPDGIEAAQSRRYGEATLWYGRRS
jgi:16S rRNA (guanine966-N2)-methyltransferase